MSGKTENFMSGLFGSSKKQHEQAMSQIVEEKAQLHAELHKAEEESRSGREKIQQLQLEKTLLQNFVDNVCGDDDGEEQEGKKIKDIVKKNQEEISTYAIKTATLTADIENITKDLILTKKKCEAFEQALQTAQQDLKSADDATAEASDVAGKVPQLQTMVDSLSADVVTKSETITELMQRMGRVQDERRKSESDFEAILAKTTEAHDHTLTELEQVREELRSSRKRVAELEGMNADDCLHMTDNDFLHNHSDAVSEVVEEAIVVESEAVELAVSSPAQVVHVGLDMVHFLELREFDHLVFFERLEKEREFLLELCTASYTAGRSNSKDALEQSHKRTLDDVTSKKKAEIEEFEQKLAQEVEDRLQLQQRVKEEDRQHSEVVSSLQEQIERLTGRVNVKDKRIEEINSFLKDSEGKRAQVEEQHNSLKNDMAELQHAFSTTRAKCETSEAKQAEAEREVETLTGRLQSALDDQEAASQLKIRNLSNMVKELKLQLQRASEVRELDVSNADTVLADENKSLLERVTQTQEKLWSAETTSKSFQEELVRLNKLLDDRNAVIQAHFVEAAQKRAQTKGKFGASFFSPNSSEINHELQTMLESSLKENLDIKNDLSAALNDIDRLQQIVDVAEENGFVEQDFFSDTEAEEVDDVFE